MAYTQGQIDALKKAISSGVLVVKHGETTTQYRSLDEMERILARMTTEVVGVPAVRRTVATFSGGV